LLNQLPGFIKPYRQERQTGNRRWLPASSGQQRHPRARDAAAHTGRASHG
jgi:hypothetical protein